MLNYLNLAHFINKHKIILSQIRNVAEIELKIVQQSKAVVYAKRKTQVGTLSSDKKRLNRSQFYAVLMQIVSSKVGFDPHF